MIPQYCNEKTRKPFLLKEWSFTSCCQLCVKEKLQKYRIKPLFLVHIFFSFNVQVIIANRILPPPPNKKKEGKNNSKYEAMTPRVLVNDLRHPGCDWSLQYRVRWAWALLSESQPSWIFFFKEKTTILKFVSTNGLWFHPGGGFVTPTPHVD